MHDIPGASVVQLTPASEGIAQTSGIILMFLEKFYSKSLDRSSDLDNNL